jgi:hypothetical protein
VGVLGEGFDVGDLIEMGNDLGAELFGVRI